MLLIYTYFRLDRLQCGLMIRANGRIGKCTVAFNDDRNDLGYINENGEVLINDKLKLWIKGLESMDVSTLACPASKLNEN